MRLNKENKVKSAKITGLLVVAAGLLALSGTATASTVTSPSGTAYTGFVIGESEFDVVLHSENAPTPFTAECSSSFTAAVQQHGSSVTAEGPNSSWSFSSCKNGVTVTVVFSGGLEFHSLGGGNATVTWRGAEFDVHVPLGFKCRYSTAFFGTDIGVLTGGTFATLDLNSATINRTGGSAFCGTGGFLTGSYRIVIPNTMFVS